MIETLKSALSLGASYVCSDLTAQCLIEQKNEIDWRRNVKFAAIGAIWVGPYVHFCLARIQKYARHWKWKILADQTLLMPVNMAVVNLAKPLLDQKSWRESIQIWRQKTPIIITTGWLYWTPVSLVLFTCIESIMMRTYVFTVFAFFWQCYLAYSINQTSSSSTPTLPTTKSN